MQSIKKIKENPLAPESTHAKFAKQEPRLSYKKGQAWEKTAQKKLRELLFGGEVPRKTPPNITLRQLDTHSYQVEFFSEPGALVTGRLVLPKNGGIVPILITLQGHALTADGISVGVTSLFGEGTEADKERYRSRGIDFATQALEEGYAVFALEQRGFGARKDQRDKTTAAHYGGRCHNPSMASLLYGRTVIGSRVHDVITSIDILSQIVKKKKLPIDMKRLGCAGHSGGGTTAYYAAALDKRIAATLISGAVCQFDDSIATIDHCVCNYIPSIRTWFEIGDIGCLIAPRPLAIVHGKQDPNFPITGVRKAVKILMRAYSDKHAKQQCTLTECEGVHRFFPFEAWSALRRATNWL